MRNLPVRVVRDGYPVETGRLLASIQQGIDWQVLLDEKDEFDHQTIGIYPFKDLEIKYPPNEDFLPLGQVLRQVGLDPEMAHLAEEFKQQCFLENPRDFLSTYHPRQRRKARGFA